MTQLPEDRDDTAKVVHQSSTGPMGRRPADTFAVRLVLARHLNAMTISEAARQSGLNDATWSTWEAGRRPRDILDVCARIAAALDIDEHWLLFGGPLAGPRGVPTKRTGEDNRRFLPVNVRPRDSRPSGRSDTGQNRATTGPTPRRPARISQSQVA